MKRKILSLLLALAVMSTMIMAVPITGYAAETLVSTMYNFSDLTSDPGDCKRNDISVFDGAFSLTNPPQSDSSSWVDDSDANGSAFTKDGYTFSKAIKAKKVGIKVTLKVNESVKLYYRGSDNTNAGSFKAVTMGVFDYANYSSSSHTFSGDALATESNDESKAANVPAIIEYTADSEGTYVIYDYSEGTKRTELLGVILTKYSSSSSETTPTVSVSPTSAEVAVGGTATLTATASGFTNSSNITYTWASDTESVATVSENGATATVTGVAAGESKITVTATDTDGNTASATCTVMVTATSSTSGNVTVYNFSDTSISNSYSGLDDNPVSIFDGAMKLGSSDSKGALSATSINDTEITHTLLDGTTTKEFTVSRYLGLKPKLTNISLNKGDTITVYYCGLDSNGAKSNTQITISNVSTSGSTQSVSDDNTESSGIMPYSVSLTATESGTCSIEIASGKRAGIYAVVVESAFGKSEAVTGYYTENNSTDETATKNYVARFYQEYSGSDVKTYGFYVMTSDGTPIEGTDLSINKTSDTALEITAGFYATVKDLDTKYTKYYAVPYVVTSTATVYGKTITADLSSAESNHVPVSEVSTDTTSE